MKRDFREEYEEFMKKDTPDLWSRIESGIEEKENQSMKQESSSLKDNKDIQIKKAEEQNLQKSLKEESSDLKENKDIQTDKSEEHLREIEKNPAEMKENRQPQGRKVVPFRRWATMAAAACVLVAGIWTVNILQRGKDAVNTPTEEERTAKSVSENSPATTGTADDTVVIYENDTEAPENHSIATDEGSGTTNDIAATDEASGTANNSVLTNEASSTADNTAATDVAPGAAYDTAETEEAYVEDGMIEEEYETYDGGLAMAGAYDTSYAAESKEAYWTDVPYMEPYPYNTETYEKNETSGFSLVSTEPLSTFSADVDTASYANVRRMIEDGYSIEWIDPNAVRPEEFINYFSYDLKDPEAGEKFGITTQIAVCPWNEKHQLMLVGMKTEDIDLSEAPPENLTFLLDVSGSMSDSDKLPLLQKSFLQLIEQLDEDDTVSIVTYANGVEVVLDSVKGSDKKAITNAINSLVAEGGTYGEGGIQKAYELAEQNYREDANNRIILATDGDLNIGISEPDELERLIKEKRDKGIYLSVLGFGTGNIRDDNMERLADCGNGNYSYIDSLLEARKVMVEEMGASFHTVAEDVKLQVEFNPEKVNAYRLIGYENRLMEATDFRDDTKDAGEIGAGHSVIALYELIPAGSEQAVELKYQKNGTVGTGDATLTVEDSVQDMEMKDSTATSEEQDQDIQDLETEEVQASEKEETEKPQASEKEEAAKEQPDYSGEYATVSVRYKEPGETSAKENSFVVSEEDFVEEPGDDLAFASAVAEFAMILRDDPNKGTSTLDGILEIAHDHMAEDEYRQEFYYMVRLLMKNSQ